MIAEKLLRESNKHKGVCVGLDTDLKYIPDYIMSKDVSLSEKVFEFNKLIIDAVCDEVACFKVQIAYYESLGLEGLSAYSRTLKYLASKEKISIADIKRGDIAATAEKYAEAHFSGEFEADYVTLNAYMGEDAISPFYSYFQTGAKGAFVLVKTSNPSGVDIQNIEVNHEYVYQLMAKNVAKWGAQFVDDSGFSSIGAVIGLTYPDEIKRIKPLMPNTFFLIPGYGAQGGTGKDLAQLFSEGICGVVNSSRGIIAAHVKKGLEVGFEEESRKAVLAMKEDIGKWL